MIPLAIFHYLSTKITLSPPPLWSSSDREVQLSIIWYFREQYVLAKSDGFGMDEKVSKKE